MTDFTNIRECDLVAILQQHYRRFIVSIEFVGLDDGETAIDVFFTNGDKERLISKGNKNEATRNLSNVSAAMAY